MSEVKFQETLDSFLSWYLQRSPVRATEMGVHSWDDKLADSMPVLYLKHKTACSNSLLNLPNTIQTPLVWKNK